MFRTKPDAVVLDVQMPRVSGYVAARVLKDDWRTADIPVILLTSLDAASDRYWGAQVGADRFLTKDFEAPQLVEAVREVIRRPTTSAAAAPGCVPDPVEMHRRRRVRQRQRPARPQAVRVAGAADVTAIAVRRARVRGDRRRGARPSSAASSTTTWRPC